MFPGDLLNVQGLWPQTTARTIVETGNDGVVGGRVVTGNIWSMVGLFVIEILRRWF